MDKPPFGDTITIIRLLHYFNDKSINSFEQCLFDALNCENEKEFLIKTMVVFSNKISIKPMKQLKNKTINIATKQKNAENVTILKQIQSHNTDRLSKLPNDIIDQLGLFLDKAESIKVGYLNRELYIQTQKKSYLFIRKNDQCLAINDKKCNKLLWAQSNVFSFNYPTNLSLNTCDLVPSYSLKQFVKSKSFANLFARINTLKIWTMYYMSHIPINILFNKSKHNNQNIDELLLFIDNESDINTFKNNINNHFSNNKNDFNNFRMIKKLSIHSDGTRDYTDAIKMILTSFSNYFLKLQIKQSVFEIKDNNMINKLFHPNLTSLEIIYSSMINFNNCLICSNDNKCKLKYLTVGIDNGDNIDEFNRFFDNMQNYVDCIDSIETLNIITDCPAMFSMLINRHSNVFSCIKQSIWKNHNLKKLKQLNIEIELENERLKMIGAFFKIMNELKDDQTTIKLIKIKLKSFYVFAQQAFVIQSEDPATHEIFTYAMSEEYNLNKREFYFKNCDLSLQSLGIIYQNLVNYFSRKLNGSIDNIHFNDNCFCTLIFCINNN